MSNQPASIYCRATLNYARNTEPIPTEVDIFDARANANLSLEDNGFTLINHRSLVSDWSDQEQIDRIYYSEIEALAKRATRCDWVFFYPALVRSPDEATKNEQLGPIHFVHSDYTEEYGGMIADEAHPYHAVLLPFMHRAGITIKQLQAASRVVTLQFWRNIGSKDMDFPLCICDAQTVKRDQLQEFLIPEYAGVSTQFKAFSVTPPSSPGQHKWYVYPQMASDELLVFRTYDSLRAEAQEPFWTPHSSFANPNTSNETPARRSIEMRAICVFHEDSDVDQPLQIE